MSTENANQPSFPVVADFGKDDKQCSEGLTKRELIAAMAMQGLLAGTTRFSNRDGEGYQMDGPGTGAIAYEAVSQADKLLAALESRTKPNN